MQMTTLIDDVNAKLEAYQTKLNENVEKLERAFTLDVNPDRERFKEEVYPILLEIDNKVLFVRKNVKNSLKNSILRKQVSENIIEIGKLILKTRDIFQSFKDYSSELLAIVISNCYQISIETSFLLSWMIINSEEECNKQGLLNAIENSLNLIDYSLNKDLENIFSLTIDDSFENYILHSINISEKINFAHQEITNSPNFSVIDTLNIEKLNKIKIYREKVKYFLKKVLDYKKNRTQEDISIKIVKSSWNQYIGLINALGDISWCRISYFDKVLELMCPGIKHENINRSIDALIVAYCDNKEIDYVLLGSTTAKKEKEKKGKEPDSGYVFGDGNEIPDLAVEINFTSGSIEDLSIYKKLGVKEVWIWDKKDVLTFYVLINDEYKTTNKSFFLQDITTEIIHKYTSLIMLNMKKTRLYKKEFIAEINQDTPESSF